jgi:GAF domain-containing protein
VGVLALLHNKPRAWPQTDAVVLKTLADQMVIALNNAGLRRLVKNLSVTDEKSGLLKRVLILICCWRRASARSKMRRRFPCCCCSSAGARR